MCVCVSVHTYICACAGHVHMYVWHSGPEQSSDSSRTAARWCLPGGADSSPACQSPRIPTSPLFISSYLVNSKSGWVVFIHCVCVCVTERLGWSVFFSDVVLGYGLSYMDTDQSRQSHEKLVQGFLRIINPILKKHLRAAADITLRCLRSKLLNIHKTY